MAHLTSARVEWRVVAKPIIGTMYYDVYSTPTPQDLPFPPHPTTERLSTYRVSYQLRRLRWYSDEHPWLPFMPAGISLPAQWLPPHAVFGDLSRDNYGVAQLKRLDKEGLVERDVRGRQKLLDHQWKISKERATYLLYIESSLRATINHLLQRRMHTTPLDLSFGPPLDVYGLDRVQWTEFEALTCAYRACDALQPLLAGCSLAIACNIGSNNPAYPEWGTALLEKLQPVWVEALRDSWLPDFKSNQAERVGCFIDATKPIHGPFFRAMLEAGIPLWIYWGTTRKRPVQEAFAESLRPYVPSDDDVGRARSAAALAHLPPWRKAQNDTVPPPRHHVCAPIDDDHKVAPGEDWRAFFARLTEEQAEIALNEDAGASQARKSRAAAAAKHILPGSEGAEVYVWERQESGERVRKRIDGKEVGTIWKDYARSQRRFNAFDNEWDLCSDFDSDAIPGVDVDVDEDPPDIEEMFVDPTSASGSAGPSGVVEEIPAAVFVALLSRVKTSHPVVQFPNLELQQILRIRYGYAPTSLVSSIESPLPLFKARKILLEEKSRIEPSAEKSITAFVGQLSYRERGSNTPSVTVDGGFWDLDAAHPWHSKLTRAHVKIRLLTLSDHTFYFVQALTSHECNSKWELALPYAAAALQCLRNGAWGSIRSIALELLALGIPFCTFRHSYGLVSSSLRSSPSMGWRPKNFVPTPGIDYQDYVAKRTEFLRGPRGRVALLRGGIVWRLAKDTVDASAVLSGPLHPDYAAPKLVLSQQGHSDCYYDDELSEEEHGLICGVYRVYTGHASQASEMSWWPQYKQWQGSGMDVGYWSDGCEAWFQARIVQFTSPDAKLLKSASEWRISLRFDAATKKLGGNYELAAHRFLEGSRITD